MKFRTCSGAANTNGTKNITIRGATIPAKPETTMFGEHCQQETLGQDREAQTHDCDVSRRPTALAVVTASARQPISVPSGR